MSITTGYFKKLKISKGVGVDIILDELKLGNFKMGIGIAENSHKTRRDR